MADDILLILVSGIAIGTGIINIYLNQFIVRRFPVIMEIKDVMYHFGKQMGLKRNMDGTITFDSKAFADSSILTGLGVDDKFSQKELNFWKRKAQAEQTRANRLDVAAAKKRKSYKKGDIENDEDYEDDVLEMHEIDWEVIEGLKNQIPSMAEVDVNNPLAQSQILSIINENEQVRKIYDGATAAMAFKPAEPKRERRLA